MTKFILLYNGPATPTENMTPEQMQGVMQKWKEWMEKLGDALVDVGQPMANGVSIVDDGSEGTATELSGYSIVQAEDMSGARALAADHPFLSDNSGKFAVEIHELMPVPM